LAIDFQELVDISICGSKKSQTGILRKIYNVRLMYLTIDLYIYSFQLFAIKLEPVNF